jgi:DNA polymerase III subunit beta
MESGMSENLNVSSINLRVLAAASAFASKEETRYYLNGVLLEIDERSATYVATDGHVLIAYRDEREHDEPDNLLLGKFIIPTAHCKAHKLKKDDDAQAKIFGVGRLTIAHEMVDVTFMPIDGTFPEWRKVLPKEPTSGELAQFNLAHLARFQKFADVLGMNKPYVAHNGANPTPIWYSGHPHTFGYIMPIRASDEAKREPPAWARGVTVEAAPAETEKELVDA